MTAAHDLDPIVSVMIEAAIAAAPVIREVYDRPHTASSKSDGSPVTEADGRAYLAAYPDVAAAHLDPLLHYLTSGMAEGRLAFGDGLAA